ncbi:D-alanyl-D-alanine carboxypeptidase family protein [Altericista sp. CCNU0014]|uniref:M15 family metallopeptidase n=1 Tax=Altericista sp. CCNU0014 TaxID=3082949 RepID=UPI00384E5791
MKWMRALGDRWPFIALTLTTAIVVMWAGATLQSIFTPQVVRPSPQATSPSPPVNPSPTLLPSWAKTAPAVAPTLPSTAIAPLPKPSAQPSVALRRSPDRRTAFRNPLPQSRYGHLPYAENISDRLVSVGTYGSGSYQRTEFLDKEAAATFAKMKADAEAEGVTLAIVSGFRSIADQEKLFARQIQRQGSEAAAARLSAPPGYSEHHTGFALDIGDGTRPQADLKFEFENTKAYQWLQTNGRRYGAELSFPPNNIQGVSFEPWHWRFTNSPYAAAIFSVAHTLLGQSAPAGASSQ